MRKSSVVSILKEDVDDYTGGEMSRNYMSKSKLNPFFKNLTPNTQVQSRNNKFLDSRNSANMELDSKRSQFEFTSKSSKQVF